MSLKNIFEALAKRRNALAKQQEPELPEVYPSVTSADLDPSSWGSPMSAPHVDNSKQDAGAPVAPSRASAAEMPTPPAGHKWEMNTVTPGYAVIYLWKNTDIVGSRTISGNITVDLLIKQGQSILNDLNSPLGTFANRYR